MHNSICNNTYSQSMMSVHVLVIGVLHNLWRAPSAAEGTAGIEAAITVLTRRATDRMQRQMAWGRDTALTIIAAAV